MINLSEHGYGDRISRDAIGHSGILGSPFAFFDPECGLAAAVILNGVSTSQADVDYIRPALVSTLVEATSE